MLALRTPRALVRLVEHQEGSLLPTFALMLVPIVSIVGAATDCSHATICAASCRRRWTRRCLPVRATAALTGQQSRQISSSQRAGARQLCCHAEFHAHREPRLCGECECRPYPLPRRDGREFDQCQRKRNGEREIEGWLLLRVGPQPDRPAGAAIDRQCQHLNHRTEISEKPSHWLAPSDPCSVERTQARKLNLRLFQIG